jgi:hypothetical protein
MNLGENMSFSCALATEILYGANKIAVKENCRV